MVAHVTHLSQKLAYVRRVFAVATISVTYLAVLAGFAGEAPAVIATWAALGTAVASAASLVVDFRAKRRDARNPWAPPTPSTATRYLIVGGCTGAVVGVALILIDTWVLA